jgi:FkbM family methyltransferase
MIFDREHYINEPIPINRELNLLFKKNGTLTIFEVGACEGEDSIRYSRLFKRSKIYSFEPLPKNVEIIKNNILKHSAENISVFNLALSSEIGQAEFYVSSGRPPDAPETDWDYGNKSSSLFPPDKHTELASFIEFNKKIIVPTTTLSAFCKSENINIIDYMHIDVQGAELLVLQGAGDFINSIKAIWLEVSKISVYKDQPLIDDVNKFMSDNNFVLAKDCLFDLQGDQLYISKILFPGYEKIVKKINQKRWTYFKKVFRKLKRTLFSK